MNENYYITESSHISLNEYTQKTFYWMFCGLLVTFTTAFFTVSSNMFRFVFYGAVPYILLIAEVLVVMILTSNIRKFSVSTARGLFFGYAVLNGLTFSIYFVIYDVSSLIFVFLLTALFFLGMAMYGKFTDTDLTALRPILVGGLIFLAVFWCLSLFFDFSAFERLICAVGVGIFMLLTAYDVQKINVYYDAYSDNPEMAQKSCIFAALQIYLDFINLFVYLLRLLGRRRD